jgi:hypothetical protein
MKKVTSADTVVMINHYKNILEAEGIPCTRIYWKRRASPARSGTNT